MGAPAVVGVVFAGCDRGGPLRAAPPAPVSGGTTDTATRKPVGDGLPSLDVLAARGGADAPLMRELLRVERAAPRSPEVRADRDLCVRAVFAAAHPVRAWFSDQAGAVRGEAASGTSGPIPPRGPACVRKGELLHLVVEGGADGEGDVSARAVLFAAP